MKEKETFDSNLHSNTNPCGNHCIPYNKIYCLLNGSQDTRVEEFKNVLSGIEKTSKYLFLSNIFCRTLVEAQNNEMESREANDRAEFWQSVAENVTKDRLTGLLTGSGLNAIIDEMYEPKLLNKLLNNSYYMQIVYVDINDLKKHNAGPGGHFQGDLAIKIVGQTLNNYAKRGRRTRKILNNQDDRRDAMQVPRTIAARSNERGDEFVVINIIARDKDSSLENIKSFLDGTMNDLYYEYGGINYKVTTTYGISEVKFPESKEKLSEAIKQIDVAMMEEKLKSKSLAVPKSNGVLVKIIT